MRESWVWLQIVAEAALMVVVWAAAMATVFLLVLACYTLWKVAP